ncbi:F-box only protein 3-like [Lineus longissimus]|uniref:F-box only protein 3-like n=1 Tax=Lineus longissimus TaxID=88925 RepID=UPI00315C7A5C
MQWYHDYGNYIGVYREIRQAWDRIEGYLKENVPMTYDMLNDGLSEKELDEVEESLNYKLPDDMRCSIRIHNGQKDATNSELVMLLGQDVPPKGVFGSGMGYMSGNDQAYYWSELLNPVQLHRSQLQSFVIGLGAIPITMASVSHLISVMVSLDESKNGSKRGQILYMSGDGSYLMDPSASYAVLADSYKEWLCQFSLDMVNGKYPVVNNELFRFYHDPECVEVTMHVKVTVGTMFLPFSHPDHPSFSYYITMSMSESAPVSASCQLETRHWLIKHDYGVDEVNGEAVVGEYPIMRPGEKFSYVSRTNIASPTGQMGGHFVFRNLETDERFQVVCPTFQLRAPRIVTFEERVERLAELKKNQ